MNRRSFLGSLVGGVAATAAVRTWPFRVFSFPTSLAMPLPDFTDKYLKTIRFINAFDLAQNRMICRWEALYGFAQLDVGPEVVKVVSLNPLIVERGKHYFLST